MIINKEKKITSAMLTAGMIAGPFYVLVGLYQVMTRPGFDITRHDLSLMSNGELGWIQIMNFVVTGLLVILCAFGIRKALHGSRGGAWGPILLILYGLGLIGAGIFVADPMNGFPPGSLGMNVMTNDGLMHLASGSIGFLGLIIACFVFSRRYFALKQKTWAMFSLLTGIIFFAAFFGIASGSQPGSPFLTTVTLGFWAAVIISFTWLALVSYKLKKEIE